MINSRKFAYEVACRYLLGQDETKQTVSLFNKHLFSLVALKFTSLVKPSARPEIQRIVDYIDRHYDVLDSMVEVLTPISRYQEFLKASNAQAFLREVKDLAEYDTHYMIPLIERIYLWFMNQLPFAAIPKDMIRDFVIPLVVTRQADRFLRANICQWKEMLDPATNAEVEELLDRVFKSKHANDCHIAVAKDTIKQGNYFFGTPGEIKKFGQYVVEIDSVKYHSLRQIKQNGYLQLNFPADKINAIPDEASRYARFHLKIKNKHNEMRSLVVHFFKTVEGSVDLKNRHDLTAFCSLSEKASSSSIWVQGVANAQLIFTALLTKNWQLIFDDNVDKMAKHCVDLWNFLKQIKPDFNLSPEQFAQAIYDGARLASFAPKTSVSLLKSNLFSPRSPILNSEVTSGLAAAVIENYDPQSAKKNLAK